MIDLGYNINFITVISNKIIKDGRKKLYLCSCKCGNVKYIAETTLKSKRIRDCGCGKYMLERHIGERYGLLTIQNCYRKRINGKINVVADCKCDCGNTKDFIVSQLKAKKIQSCGCLNNFNPQNYINKKYGKIKILDFTNVDKKMVKCLCDCGNIFERSLYKITSNVIYKNGCSFCTSKKYCEENNIPYTKKCPLGISRIKRIFKGMLYRCYNPNAKDYKWYGAKGIIIDEIWLQNKNNFINWALANGYRDDLTIDRIDGDGNYEPSNCRWVDIKTQQNNRKNNVKFLYEGKMLSINEISKIIKINSNTLRSRLRKGMTLEEAIKKPVSKRR